MENKRAAPSFPVRIVGVSIAMLTVMLCITVFSVLSHLEATAEDSLSKKNAAHQLLCSECDADAQRLLASFIGELAHKPQKSVQEAISSCVENARIETQANGDVTAYFETPMRECCHMSVAVAVNASREVSVLKYEIVSSLVRESPQSR